MKYPKRRSPPTIFRRRFGTWAHVLSLIAFSLSVAVPAMAADLTSDHPARLPNMDRRTEAAAKGKAVSAKSNPQREQAENALRARLPKVKIQRHAVVNSPRWIAAGDEFLTGSNGAGKASTGEGVKKFSTNDPHRVVKGFVDEHAALFGHDSSALANARVSRDYFEAKSGMRTTVWEQQHEGLPIFEAVFIGHVTKKGELINVSSQFLPRPAEAALKGMPKRAAGEIAPVLTAAQAISKAAAHLGDEPKLADDVTALDAPEGVERRQKFRGGAVVGEAIARLCWLPLNETEMRLCWKISLTSRAQRALFHVLVDAETGEVWVRNCLTSDATLASYRVYTSDSPTPFSPGYSSPGNQNQPPAVSRQLLSLTALDNTASPNGWINDGVNETRGNNVDAHTDLDADNVADTPRPQGSPSRVFDFPMNLAQEPTTYRSATVVQLFYLCNWIHDRLYQFGFTESAGNFQNDNFGRGGAGNDAVQADAQDGEGVNNANFGTDDDGIPPRMQMYLYTDPTPDRDGTLDSGVVIHEYVHGLSNRRVGGGVLITAGITKGLGEGWSDFYALALLAQSGDSMYASYPVSSYARFGRTQNGVTYDPPGDNYYFGSRLYPYGTDLNRSPRTFKDIDGTQDDPHFGVPANPVPGVGGPGEVHQVGEVWCNMLWEVYAELILKHGFATGNPLALQLVTDAMDLCPPNPDFIEARDAILQADLNMGGGNRNEIWRAFAKRGLGYYAEEPGPLSVVEDFATEDPFYVSPKVGSSARGPVGGPFTAFSKIFTLTNSGNSTVPWRVSAEPPLNTPIINGANLAAHSSANITISFNATALAYMQPGIYNPSAYFTNTATGTWFKRSFTVYVLEQNIWFEEFEGTNSNDAFDLSGMNITFTPNTNGGYTLCRSLGSGFPTTPIGGTELAFDLFQEFNTVTLTNGASFPFYGTNYTNLHVSYRGFINLVEAYGDYEIGSFFADDPRIAVLGREFDDSVGKLSWKQLANRVVFTWQDMKSATGPNNFQAELYFDGRIRLSWPSCVAQMANVGLLPGPLPSAILNSFDLFESNFSAAPTCGPFIILELPATVIEGQGSVTGRVTSINQSAFPLSISLSSSDTSEITVPSTVTISPNGSTATFVAQVGNDAYLDGPQIAYVTASASGRLPATVVVRILDDETTLVKTFAPSTTTEGNGPFNCTVTLNSPPVNGVVPIFLMSSKPEELVPLVPVVFIPPGQTSVVFQAQAVDDNRVDGTQSVSISGVVGNWPSVSDTISVRDNESTNLTMFTFPFLTEGVGTVTNGGRITLGGLATSNILILLNSLDTSEIITPWFAFIPAGSSNAQFDFTVVDDTEVDGLQLPSIIAEATGFRSATNLVFVFDNDYPPEPFDPHPADGATNVLVDTDLSWGRTDGDLIVNGTFTTGTLEGWTQQEIGAGGWLINDGTFDPDSPDGPSAPYAGGFSAVVNQLGNGTHVLYQDVLIPAGSLSATLSWADRIRNHATVFAGNQQFRVEVCNATNNVVLATLFTTQPGMPLLNEWTNRTFNVTAWSGTPIRIAFVETDAIGNLNVGLDNVSLLATAAATTLYDVYFGTNNPPTSGDRLGTTSAESFTLPMLAGGTDYYWQLKSRRGAFTNDGPVWHFTTEGSSSLSNLITFGSSWRYRNTGQNLGTTWTNLNYADGAWSSGVGVLGFGGGQDTTIGVQSNGIVTFYFRRKFTLSDTSRIASVTARLIRDDGAIVWINGRAAMLENVPRPPLDYLDQASTEINGFPEIIPVIAEISPSLLVEGTNIVAVEMHQRHPQGGFSDDLSFDFELKAIFNTGNEAPAVELFDPPNSAHARVPTNLTMRAIVTDESVLFTSVSFYADGQKIGTDTASPYAYVWTNPPPGQHILQAVATDFFGASGTSAPNHVVILPASGTLFTLVPAGSIWKFDDSGDNLGTNWISLNYDDRRWGRGPAQLGYGDGDEATVVEAGRSDLIHNTTTYFRHRFTNNATISSLTLRTLRDDGAVVYLNGVEIWRNNMPGGTITNLTRASTNVVGVDENTFFAASIPPSRLVAGANILAVEIHQYGNNNVDMSFDLELTGLGNALPNVTLTSPTNNASFLAPPSIPLIATASDPYGAALSKVDFYRNGTSLGSALSPPYQLSWLSPTGGLYALTAVAIDSQLGAKTSAPVNVRVYQPAPLKFRQSNNQFELAWPITAGPWIPETATNMMPPVLWDVLPGAVQTNGEFRIIVSPAEAERYFRLRSQ